MKEVIIWEENTEEVNFYGLMAQPILENFKITIFMEKELIVGLMEENS